MANQRAEIEVVVNGGQAKASLNNIAKAVDGVATSADRSSTALEGMGSGTEAGVEKAVKATKRYEEQLKRLNLELESGGKNTAAYIEGRAKLAGADTAALAPLIAQYDQLRAKQAIANAEFTKAGKVMTDYGMSVAATNAALRQVPAQFTDIIVSLQGGQAPMTVLLQQGGQLKDVFGGVGNAARALGGYVLGLVNPFTVFAGAVAGLAVAYEAGASESRALNSALILSGNQAGVTTGQLMAMAAGIDQVSGTQGAAAEALALFAGSGKVGAENLEQFTLTAIRFEKVTGTALSETAKKFEELRKAPLEATLKLNDSMGYLTQSIYDQLKALTDQGRAVEAATLAQSEFNRATESMTKDMEKNLGIVERSWNAVKSVVKETWDAVKGIGRDAGLEGQVAAAQKMVDLRRQAAESIYGTEADRKKLKDAENQLAGYQDLLRNQQLSAKYAAERTEQVKQGADWDKAGVKYLTDAVKLERELAAAKQLGIAAGKTEVEIAQREAEIRKSFAKAPKTSREEVNKAAKEDIAAFKVMEALREKAKGDEMKRAEDSIAAAEKARNAVLLSHAKELETLSEKAQKLEDEVAMYGMSKESIEALTTARMLDRIEVLKGFDNSAEEIARIEEVIAARQRLAAAGTAKDQKDASTKAAKDAADEWKKASEKINDTLTDALMRGFESGKDFAKNLRDTVVNMFKTMVLRPVISAVMNPIAQGITGSLGLAGTANAGTSALGTASNAYSAFGTVAGGASAFGSAFSAGAAVGTEAFGAGMTMMAEASGMSSFMAGAGQALGALGPAGWAALAVTALVASGAFSGETRSGATYTTGADGKVQFAEGPSGGEIAGDQARMLFNATQATINSTLKAVGSTATLTGFTAGLESSDNGKGFQFAGGYVGGNAFGENLGRSGGQFGMQSQDQKTAFSNYSTQLSQSIIEALQATADIPGTVAQMITDGLQGASVASLTAEASTALLANINTVVGTVNTLRDSLKLLPFESLKNLSFDAAAGLIATAGGLDALGNNLNGYYDNFYTAEEKRTQLLANTTKSFSDLGLTMPALDAGARSAYRALVDQAAAQDLSVEANARAYTGLLSLQGAVNELAPVLENVASATDGAVGTISDFAANLQKVTESLQSTGADLQDQFDKLYLSEADYRAKQISGMTALQVAQYDTNEALRKSIAAFYDTAEAAKAAAAFAAEAARATAATLEQSKASLLTGAAAGASDALAALGRAVNAQKASDAAAFEAQKAIATAAYTSQQEVMQASIDATTTSLNALSDGVGKLKSLSDALKSTLDGLRIAGSDQQYRTDAQAQITAALQTARSGGGLPIDGQLDSALRTISQPSEMLFGSFEDYARDFYSTANDIAALADLTGAQLTDAQISEALLREQLKTQQDSRAELKDGFTQQASALDSILETARLQLDAANGLNTSVLSIPEALAQIANAIAGLEQVRATQGLATTPGSAVAAAAVAAKPFNSADTTQGRADTIREYMRGLQENAALSDTEKAVVLAARAQAVGVPESEIASAWGASAKDTRAFFAAAGVPQFSQGINRVPFDMTARIHEGEAIVPRQFNPYNPNAPKSSDNADVVAELKAVRLELAELKAVSRDGNVSARRTAEILDNVTQGGDAMLSKAA